MAEIDLPTFLEAQISKAGGVRALSRKIGLSAAFISDVQLKRREPGPKLLAALRLRKKVHVIREVRYYTGSGKLTPKAVEELMWFSMHLKEHPKAAPVEGCRFCDERVRLAAELEETRRILALDNSLAAMREVPDA